MPWSAPLFAESEIILVAVSIAAATVDVLSVAGISDDTALGAVSLVWIADASFFSDVHAANIRVTTATNDSARGRKRRSEDFILSKFALAVIAVSSADQG